MLYPQGLSQEQAKTLVVDAEAAFVNGTAKTNKAYLECCPKCGIRFASKSFRFCPICTMNKAERIELQNSDKDLGIRLTLKEQRQRIFGNFKVLGSIILWLFFALVFCFWMF